MWVFFTHSYWCTKFQADWRSDKGITGGVVPNTTWGWEWPKKPGQDRVKLTVTPELKIFCCNFIDFSIRSYDESLHLMGVLKGNEAHPPLYLYMYHMFFYTWEVVHIFWHHHYRFCYTFQFLFQVYVRYTWVFWGQFYAVCCSQVQINFPVHGLAYILSMKT